MKAFYSRPSAADNGKVASSSDTVLDSRAVKNIWKVLETAKRSIRSFVQQEEESRPHDEQSIRTTGKNKVSRTTLFDPIVHAPSSREGDNRKPTKKRSSRESIQIPNKKRRSSHNYASSIKPFDRAENDAIEQSSEEKLNLSILPMQPTLKKDPFNCDTEHSSIRPNGTLAKSAIQYGTAFYRRRRKLKTSVVPHNQIQTQVYGLNPEVSFLRMVYNGEYKVSMSVDNERKRQLKLLEQDSQEHPSFRKSIKDLTNRIKNLLLEEQALGRSQGEDIQIIREKKVDPLALKREEFFKQKLKFDRSIVSFEEEFKSYKKLIEERRRIQAEIRRKKKELIPILPAEAITEVQDTLSKNEKGILSNSGNFQITVRDFKTLAPRRWLNDTIIEYFMRKIEMQTPDVVAFNSFFYSTLLQRGYQGVRRWMKRKKRVITELRKVFVPINLNQTHWALGVIDISNSKILYADSLTNAMNSTSYAIMKDLQTYVIEESGNKIGQDFELLHIDCPQQPNGYDCGVYVCTNTLYLSKGEDLTFNYTDAARMRIYIGSLILNEDKKTAWGL